MEPLPLSARLQAIAGQVQALGTQAQRDRARIAELEGEVGVVGGSPATTGTSALDTVTVLAAAAQDRVDRIAAEFAIAACREELQTAVETAKREVAARVALAAVVVAGKEELEAVRAEERAERARLQAGFQALEAQFVAMQEEHAAALEAQAQASLDNHAHANNFNGGGNQGEFSPIDGDLYTLASRLARCTYDFENTDDDPDLLEFCEGDIITVFGEADEDGFYAGEVTEGPGTEGPRGLVPSNYIHFLTDDEAAAFMRVGDAGGGLDDAGVTF